MSLISAFYSPCQWKSCDYYQNRMFNKGTVHFGKVVIYYISWSAIIGASTIIYYVNSKFGMCYFMIKTFWYKMNQLSINITIQYPSLPIRILQHTGVQCFQITKNKISNDDVTLIDIIYGHPNFNKITFTFAYYM